MSILAGKSVLVTGGTGSFGHAFVRRALGDDAKKVIILSRDELKQAQMAAQFNDPRIRFFLGDVRDRERLRLALDGVGIVIHAAAMKRIEACEAEPTEAMETNINGTLNVALESIKAGVERAVFLSTDKAPHAHTLYGMTKATAERVWSRANVFTGKGLTRLSCTRYGNVLGSRGSVLDLWREQYQRGIPLTITHERATRFWMTIEQAVDLVLLALCEMRGGETFVPKIGSAALLDLARAVVEGEGTYAPGHVVTGFRPGERMHETLISSDESRTAYDCGTHYVIEPESRTWADVVEPLGFPLVGEGFSYRSDTNEQQFTVGQLREMIT